MAVKKGGVKIAHGGACPPGQIFDHNFKSPTYGKCIPIVAKRKKPKPKPGMGREGFRYG